LQHYLPRYEKILSHNTNECLLFFFNASIEERHLNAAQTFCYTEKQKKAKGQRRTPSATQSAAVAVKKLVAFVYHLPSFSVKPVTPEGDKSGEESSDTSNESESEESDCISESSSENDEESKPEASGSVRLQKQRLVPLHPKRLPKPNPKYL
jgi:hypothetical protein